MTVQIILLLVIIGLTAGVLSGLVGVGGGIIVVPALVFFLGFTQPQAQGTSLGLLLLPVGILAVLNYYKQGHIDIRVIGIMAIAFVSWWMVRQQMGFVTSGRRCEKNICDYPVLFCNKNDGLGCCCYKMD